MKRFLRKIILILASFFLVICAFVAFLLATTPGLFTTIKLTQAFLPGKIHVQKLQGRLIDKLSFKRLTYTVDNSTLILEDGALSWNLMTLLKRNMAIQSTIKSITLDDNPPITQFTLHAQQSENEWRLEALQGLIANNQITLQGRIGTENTFPVHLRLTTHARKGALLNTSGALNLDGTLDHYQWSGRWTKDLPLNVDGSLDAGETIQTSITWPYINLQRSANLQTEKGKLLIKGHLPQFALSLDTQVITPIKSTLSLTAMFNDNRLTANAKLNQPQGEMTASLTHANSQTHAKIMQGNNHLIINGTFPYPLKAYLNLPEPELVHPSLSHLKTKLSASIETSAAQSGLLRLFISPGIYQLPEETGTNALHFLGGQIHGTLNQDGLKASGKLAIDSDKALELQALLPGYSLNKPFLASQKYSGSIHLSLQSLAFLEQLSTEIKNAKGRLDAELKSSGTFNKHQVNGELSLKGGSLTLPRTGITFSPMDATLTTTHQKWQFKGHVKSQGQSLEAKGSGQFHPDATGKVAITANNFPVIDTAEYRIEVTPKLNILFEKNTVDIQGSLTIPRAKIAPVTFTNTEDLTEDAVYVGQDRPPEKPLGTKMDLELTAGDNVVIDTLGLNGTIKGNVHLTQVPHSPISASGEFRIEKGRYQAYGQDLTIDQGELIYAGGLLTNPGIQVRAVRRFSNPNSSFSGSDNLLDFSASNLQSFNFGDNTTVGIEVSGRLRSPQIKLFSVPPTLSQADILSLLLLGKPVGQATGSSGELLMSAISALNLGSGSKGTQLLSQINQGLGLDFGLTQSQQYNRDTNETTQGKSFSIGKKISNRMYASYSVGLFKEDNNVFTLRYLLNKFFSIQINASDNANGIDLLYTRHKNS